MPKLSPKMQQEIDTDVWDEDHKWDNYEEMSNDEWSYYQIGTIENPVQFHRDYGTLNNMSTVADSEMLRFETSKGFTVFVYADQIHNPDGPAVIGDQGEEEYWVHGMKVSEHEFNFFYRNQQ